MVLGREIGRLVGGEKGAKVVGNSLAVIGTFLASGLFHEVSMSAMGRGWDNAPIIFFAMQVSGASVLCGRVLIESSGAYPVP